MYSQKSSTCPTQRSVQIGRLSISRSCPIGTVCAGLGVKLAHHGACTSRLHAEGSKATAHVVLAHRRDLGAGPAPPGPSPCGGAGATAPAPLSAAPAPELTAPAPGSRCPGTGLLRRGKGLLCQGKRAELLAPGVLRQGDTWLGELARQEAHSDGCSDDLATLQARKRLEPRCFRAWS